MGCCYLKAAPVDHPAEYANITSDRKLAQLVTLLMDRAEYALSLPGNDPRLGLQEAAIRPYVDQKALVNTLELRKPSS